MNDYNLLKDIVAPLHLCRKIPNGTFTNTALVWMLNGTGKHSFWAVTPRDATTDEDTFIPAPTLKEIMKELPSNINYCFIYEGCEKFCILHPKFDPNFATHEIPESAALLFFLIYNIRGIQKQPRSSYIPGQEKQEIPDNKVIVNIKSSKTNDDSNKFRIWDDLRKEYYRRGNIYIASDGTLCEDCGENGMTEIPPWRYQVERCTGVRCHATDNLIYKGDIVKYNYPGAPANVVDWNSKTCRWVVRAIKDVGMTEAASFCDDGILPTDGYVIVGNIHEVKND